MNGKPLVLDSLMFEPANIRSVSVRSSTILCDDKVLVSMILKTQIERTGHMDLAYTSLDVLRVGCQR